MSAQGNTGQPAFAGFGVTTTSASTPASFGFGSTPQSAGFGALQLGTAPSTTTAKPSGFTFGSFGSTAAAPSAATGAATTASSTSIASGFGFGAGSAQASSGLSLKTAPTTAGAFAFGAPATQNLGTTGMTKQASESTFGTQLKFGSAATASQPTTAEQPKSLATAGFGFGQTQISATKPALVAAATGATLQQSVAATSSTAFASLSAKPTVSSQSTTQFGIASATSGSVAQASSSSVVPSAPEKSMTFKQLEDVINKWVHELEEQEKNFLNQAKQVNTWDRLLIENGEKITVLNTEIERLKTDQGSLDRELDYILSKQQELEELLNPLEEQIKEQQAVPYMQHADLEREKTYKMAESIDSQLKGMMQDLKDIIDHINNSNTNLRDPEDPMGQIAKILNSHMDSLQWVDQNGMLLQRRVEDVSKQVENRKREHERSLRLTFD